MDGAAGEEEKGRLSVRIEGGGYGPVACECEVEGKV